MKPPRPRRSAMSSRARSPASTIASCWIRARWSTSLETALSHRSELWALPAKFCFVVDGGGASAARRGARRHSSARRARRQPHQLGGRARWPGRRRVAWRGDARPGLRRRPRSCSTLCSARFACRDAHARRVGPRQAAASAGRRSNSIRLAALPAFRAKQHPLGVIENCATATVGFAAPFGRIDAVALRRLGQRAAEVGAREVARLALALSIRACAGPRSGQIDDRGGGRSRPHRRSHRPPAFGRCLPRGGRLHVEPGRYAGRGKAPCPGTRPHGHQDVPRLGVQQGLRTLRARRSNPRRGR